MIKERKSILPDDIGKLKLSHLKDLELRMNQLELALAKHCHRLPDECIDNISEGIRENNRVFTEEEDRYHCEGEIPCKGYFGACSNRAIILRESGVRVCIKCNERIEKDKG